MRVPRARHPPYSIPNAGLPALYLSTIAQMSPILRKARIAGDGVSPGSSPYDRGRADKTKVERNKHGCLTCRYVSYIPDPGIRTY